VTAGILLLAAVGLARMAWFHLAVESRLPRRASIDDRYAAARAVLPASGAIGYVSDRRVARTPAEYEASPGTRAYIEAQYALAPLVLRAGDDSAPRVLVVASDGAALPALVERRGLVPVAEIGPGLLVARPGPR